MVLLNSWQWSEAILGNTLCFEVINTLLFVREATLASGESTTDINWQSEFLAKVLLAWSIHQCGILTTCLYHHSDQKEKSQSLFLECKWFVVSLPSSMLQKRDSAQTMPFCLVYWNWQAWCPELPRQKSNYIRAAILEEFSTTRRRYMEVFWLASQMNSALEVMSQQWHVHVTSDDMWRKKLPGASVLWTLVFCVYLCAR